MKKLLAFHAGRIGDIFMGIPSFDLLREKFPEHHLLINIHKDYKDIAPLLYNQKNVDGVFVSDEYQEFPNGIDLHNIQECGIDLVFDPMHPRQDEGYWFTRRHQVSDIAYQYNLLKQDDCHKIKKINLNKWFRHPDFSNSIAFHATPANYDKNNKKAFSLKKSQELVNHLFKLGYNTIQVGSPNDPKLEGCTFFNTDYFNSVRNILGCKMFIGFDSGLTWTLSGYDFPVLAFYNNEYYTRNGMNYVSSIQPVNPNAIYIDRSDVKDISNDLIIDKIKEII